MIRHFLSLLTLAAFAATLYADDTTADAPFQRLTRTDLEKVEGVWRLAFNTKDGWKGTLTAKVKLYSPPQIEAGCGAMRFDYEFSKDKQKRSGQSAAGFDFAALQRGETKFLVRVDASDLDEKQVPSEAKPSGEGMVPFQLADDTLKLDASKAVKTFFSFAEEVDLDWSKVELKRMKQK